jgi:hypothetical protein
MAKLSCFRLLFFKIVLDKKNTPLDVGSVIVYNSYVRRELMNLFPRVYQHYQRLGGKETEAIFLAQYQREIDIKDPNDLARMKLVWLEAIALYEEENKKKKDNTR